MLTLPDVHPLVRKVLVDDSDVRHLVRDRVYAGKYPPTLVELPAVRFRFQYLSPTAPPTAEWWRMTGQVDCHADSESEADVLVGAVLDALLRLEGTTHDGAVVQGVFNWGVIGREDNEWTPPKPMRIVTVTLTARAV